MAALSRWRTFGRKLCHVFCCYSFYWYLFRVYNHIKPPSVITSGCDYMLFKVTFGPMVFVCVCGGGGGGGGGET